MTALRLRMLMTAHLGAELTCAVMRVTTRHGRLDPGLAPKIEGPVVNSEKEEMTPPDELLRLAQRQGLFRGLKGPMT